MKIGPLRVGMRTAKTAAAVFICILLFHVANRGNPMIAALSAVFSLRQDFKTSVKFGKTRVIGNCIGGSLAIIYFFAANATHHSFYTELIVIPILLIVNISVSTAIGNTAGIISATATLLMISLNIPKDETFIYALERVLDTFIGTLIAIGLNVFLQPPKEEKVAEIKEDLQAIQKREESLEDMVKEISADAPKKNDEAGE